MEKHYNNLQNTLPQQDNNALQETAREIDARYDAHPVRGRKHRVM